MIMKKFLKKIKDKFKELKVKKDKIKKIKEERECVMIEKLPEKVEYKLKLDEVITFPFLFRTWIIILLLIYLWYIAANSLDILYAIFTAFIISMALETSILFFSKLFPRSFSIVLSYFLLFFMLILWFIILIPFLLSHMSQIIDILIQKVSFFQTQLETKTLSDIIKWFHLYPYIENKLLIYAKNPDIANKIREFLTINMSNILQTFWWYMKTLSSYAFSTITWIFTAISQIIIVFTLAIFFSFEKEKVVYTLAQLSQTPKKTAIKLKKLYSQLWEWLKGQVLLWIFIWISVYIGLWTLSLVFGIDLENKWTLALMAGLMEFIPYLWPILWSLPSLLVWALSYGFSWFVIVWVLFIIIQQIEGFIVPIIMNKALWVSPLMIIIMMLIWMKVMGLVWIILAIPFAVIVSLLFEEKLQKD